MTCLKGNSRFFPRPLVFLHIPKAAGSTMQEIVVRHYRGGKGFRFTGSRERFRSFVEMSEADRASYDVMTGHVPFGVHRHIPGGCAYMTMLRDPVDRIVSHYYFVLSRPDHYLHRTVTERKMSLRDYVEQRASIELDNDQTRYFLEPADDEARFTPITDDLLAVARRNIAESFAVVGLAERFDDTLALMQCVFGWLDLSYRRKNVTHDRPSLEEVPSDAREVIREINRHDVALYAFARELFERRIAEHGPHFAASRRALDAGGRGEPVPGAAGAPHLIGAAGRAGAA